MEDPAQILEERDMENETPENDSIVEGIMEGSSEESEDDEDVYEVEKIIEKRKKGRSIQYLVKWKGYDEDQNTWEPVKNLQNDDV
jgi:hypothetical protein